MNKWLRIGTVVLLVVLAVPAFVLGPYAMRVQKFPAAPENGYFADFYLYVSPEARQAGATGEPVVLLVQPNNSGINSDDPQVHSDDAWWMGFGRSSLAGELKTVLLVPGFSRPNKDWRILTHALDRDVLTTSRTDLARLDLQLLRMIDAARADLARQDLKLHPKFLLQGYSASGSFASRFAALHPQHVLALSAGAPGGWPIAPLASHAGEPLPYPAGIADLQELTGQPFDSTSYRVMPQLIVLGSEDKNDALDFGDGWDKEASHQVQRLFGETAIARWPASKKLYQQAGANARFLLVEGVGHDRKALQHHTTAFFQEVLQNLRNASQQ